MINKFYDDPKAFFELRQHYRNVFSSTSGKIVFHDMLYRSYFFNDDLTHDNPEALGRRNFIMEIINILGSADDPLATSFAIAEAIINLPMVSKLDKPE